jgi:glycogen operon protein
MLSPAKRARALHEGSVMPLGVKWIEEEEAYNFSLYSRHARSVTLLFYTADDQTTPCFSFTLDPFTHRTTQLWHCRLPRALIGEARYYGYQIDGPSAQQSGWRHAFRFGKGVARSLRSRGLFSARL